jgi:uncharacterized protein YjiS (DUF1127 family)
MTTVATIDAGLLVAGAGRNPGRAGRLRQAWARYAAYRKTLAELKDLSERQLADLGTTRGDLKRLARAAVYGN